MKPQGGTTKAQKDALFKAATLIAEALGDDFVGRVEVNIFKGGVGSMEVVETGFAGQVNLRA